MHRRSNDGRSVVAQEIALPDKTLPRTLRARFLTLDKSQLWDGRRPRAVALGSVVLMLLRVIALKLYLIGLAHGTYDLSSLRGPYKYIQYYASIPEEGLSYGASYSCS
jgi:hypothetical protein